MRVHIDVETYCELDIRKVGAYKYCNHSSFEILLFAYWHEGMSEVAVLDCTDTAQCLAAGAVYAAATEILAHNASFEREACKSFFGHYANPNVTFSCSLVKAAYFGLPLALGQVSEALNLEIQKDKGGTALINTFSKPCKPTAANGMRERNTSEHEPEKWQRFKDYCKRDVETEMAITYLLKDLTIPEREIKIWNLDAQINQNGVLVDVPFVRKAMEIDRLHREQLMERARELTGVDNPNSNKQLIDWFNANIGETEGTFLEREYVTSMKKADVAKMLENAEEGAIKEMLEIRQQLSKSSVKKYGAIMFAVNKDKRVRGLFQYYGANRTGRWAGRLVQMQNLPRGTFDDEQLAVLRNDVLTMDAESFLMTYDNIGDILSSLIRSSFIAPKGKVLCVADLSAIEARVLAWVAKEKWRMEVFNSHGKIYEASAASMMNIPIEQVDSKLRQKGKVAELALGYQGGVGALVAMGAEKMGLSPDEMSRIVTLWRKANPSIVNFWKCIETAARTCIVHRKKVKWHLFTFEYIRVNEDLTLLALGLPSGRSLHYANPSIERGKIVYWGLDDKKKWAKIANYGGKFTENVVQAIARDVLAEGLWRSRKLDINLHVHDEIGIEADSEELLETLIKNMSGTLKWATDLPLKADGFTSPFYKK